MVSGNRQVASKGANQKRIPKGDYQMAITTVNPARHRKVTPTINRTLNTDNDACSMPLVQRSGVAWTAFELTGFCRRDDRPAGCVASRSTRGERRTVDCRVQKNLPRCLALPVQYPQRQRLRESEDAFGKGQSEPTGGQGGGEKYWGGGDGGSVGGGGARTEDDEGWDLLLSHLFFVSLPKVRCSRRFRVRPFRSLSRPFRVLASDHFAATPVLRLPFPVAPNKHIPFATLSWQRKKKKKCQMLYKNKEREIRYKKTTPKGTSTERLV